MKKYAYWATIILIGSVPAANIPINAVGSLGRVIGIAAIGVWLLSLAFKTSVRRFHLYVPLFCCFILWHITSVTWSADPAKTLEHFVRYIQYLAMTIMLWDVLRSRRQVDGGIQTYVLGCYIAIGLILYNHSHNVVFTQNEGAERVSATGFDVNDLALVLAMGIPMAWNQVINPTDKHWALRLINLLYPLVGAIGIILTNSRAVLIASIPAWIYILSTLHRLPRQAKNAFAVGVVAIVAVGSTLDLSKSFSRWGTIVKSATQEGATGRTQIWALALKRYAQSPILGIGGGAFPSMNEGLGLRSGVVTHNTYISILTELGTIGMMLFLALLGCVVLAAWRHPPQERIGWLMVIVVWAIGVFSISWEYRPMMWVVFGLIIASSACFETAPERRSVRARSLMARGPHWHSQPKGMNSLL